MLIWIRSQDRKILAAVNAVNIRYNQYNQTTYDVRGHNTNYILGTYATKERAIEVLNDIMIAIEKQLKVFQMPKE